MAIESIRFRVDGALFPPSVVRRVAYELRGRCNLELEEADGHVVEIRLTAAAEPADLGALETEFRNLLIDYSVRDSIAAETRGIRDTLIAAALGRPPDRLD